MDHRQNNSYVKAVHGDLASAKQLVYSANCCFNCCAEQSHKDNVRNTAVEEQLKQKAV